MIGDGGIVQKGDILLIRFLPLNDNIKYKKDQYEVRIINILEGGKLLYFKVLSGKYKNNAYLVNPGHIEVIKRMDNTVNNKNIDYKKQGKSNRRKGHSFERSIVKDLKSIGLKDAKRHLEYQPDDIYGVDIDNVGEFNIQCKSKKQYVPVNTLEEIKATDGINILVTKANRKDIMAVIKWSDMLKLMEAYIANS